MLTPLVRRVLPDRLRPVVYLTDLTRRRCDSTVISGPFASMRYIEDPGGCAYIPKLLGIYERELHRWVDAACRLSPSTFINIGAAEGYYAVGLALRNPKSKVIAFEMDPDVSSALERMVALNHVEPGVEIRGKCETRDLNAILTGNHGRAVVICDVEGGEAELLDPAAVRNLSDVWMLVELHESIVPGITRILKERFAATHVVSQVWQGPRSRTEYPFRTLGTRLLPRMYLDWTVTEWRSEHMSWLWMEPVNGR